jgi:putative ABC transport system permease protein
VANAVPTVVGDTYQGKYRIVGTYPSMFGYDVDGQPLPADRIMNYRPGRHLEMDQGRVFAPNKFQAVVGSDIPRLTGLSIGSIFQATHGIPLPSEKPDIHAEKWTVVGILAPTHTAIDRVLYIPLNSFYTIAEHGVGLIAQEKLREGQLPDTAAKPEEADEDTVPPVDGDGIQHFKNYDYNTRDGTLKITLPPSVWALSAILVQSRGGVTGEALRYDLNNGTDVMAVNPASVMREFFDTFLKPTRQLLLGICSLVTVVAAVGILVSIYNSVSARLKEIAILRALGATRKTVLSLICLEAAVIAAIGSVLGVAVGHGINALGAWYMMHRYGEVLQYDYREVVFEAAYVACVIAAAVVAGLVPAMKAYRTPVATYLVAS